VRTLGEALPSILATPPATLSGRGDVRGSTPTDAIPAEPASTAADPHAPALVPVDTASLGTRPALKSVAVEDTQAEGAVANEVAEWLHVSSDLYASAAPVGPLMIGAGVATGLAGVAALATAPAYLRKKDVESQVEGYGKLALAADSGLTCGALLTYGGPISETLVMASRPFGFLHGASDIYLGVKEIQAGKQEHSVSRIARGVFETGMGIGSLGASLAPAYGAIPIVLTCGVMACELGKEFAVRWNPQNAALMSQTWLAG